MGFVTLDLVSADGKPGAPFQLSESALTISRLRNLMAIAGRIPLSNANRLRVTYVDDEGDAITCATDDDVKELYSVASSHPAKMTKVWCCRCLVMCFFENERMRRVVGTDVHNLNININININRVRTSYIMCMLSERMGFLFPFSFCLFELHLFFGFVLRVLSLDFTEARII